MKQPEQDLTQVCADIEDRIGTVLTLEETGAWPDTKHKLDAPSARAIVAALAAGRPLLVRGEPGVGKSQLARAAAHLLQRPFLAAVIQPDSDYQALLWALDHTARLADAQLGDKERVKRVANYIGPGALWWALDWPGAAIQAGRCNHNFNPADDIDAVRAKASGCVLLIDEVDKADIALANGLLEVLGNRQFAVESLGKTVKADAHPPPLVVLTTNDSRQLPAALLRRCVVLPMTLPDDIHGHFVERGQTHFPKMDPEVLAEAAGQILADRAQCSEQAKTGLAEYLDLLQALHRVAPNDADEQHNWLTELGSYFGKSHAA